MMNPSFRSSSRLGTFVLLLVMPALARADVTVLLHADLFPTDIEPLATGRASDWETLGHPFTAQLTVQVQDIATADTVDVLLNGEYVTTITLTDGSGQVTLTGHLGDDVPFVSPGDVVDIVNAEDGTLLLEGVFDRGASD